MSLWNKILLGLIFVASLGFFYTAARTLKTQKSWREYAQGLQHKLTAQLEENRKLLESDEAGNKGIRRLSTDLQRLLINRGRIWQKCEPQRAAANGQVAVGVEQAAGPGKITDKMVLYVFEEGDDQQPREYLGEFKVGEVAENKIGLAPTMALTGRELKRLTGSKGPWTLYELMPADRHLAFSDLPEDDRRALFSKDIVPKEVVEEYVRDGHAARADDPKQCQVDGKYVRPLRDYKELFRSYQTDHTLFVDVTAVLEHDQKYLNDAKDDADRQVQFAQQYVTSLKTEYGVAAKEQRAAGGFRALLEQRLAAIQDRVAKLIAGNQGIAAEITNLQVQAARWIDARTKTMAQSGAGNR
ncbi:MAG: hypothetical protein ABSG86_02600 [Thermoguttaceae bacterium]|jgi:hypothetical protein